MRQGLNWASAPVTTEPLPDLAVILASLPAFRLEKWTPVKSLTLPVLFPQAPQAASGIASQELGTHMHLL